MKFLLPTLKNPFDNFGRFELLSRGCVNTLGKRVRCNSLPGFESQSLRQINRLRRSVRESWLRNPAALAAEWLNI